ncbi:MAG: F-box protein [Rhabdochlamydiaceae bacterium]|nr:F-box protein [Candidatus Amphrikana amoebophyrae]
MDGVRPRSSALAAVAPRRVASRSILPEELLLKILAFAADSQSLTAICGVSRYFYQLAKLDKFWKVAISSIYFTAVSKNHRDAYIVWKKSLLKRSMTVEPVAELRRPLFSPVEQRRPGAVTVSVNRPLVRLESYYDLSVCNDLALCIISPHKRFKGCSLAHLGKEGKLDRMDDLSSHKHIQLTESGKWLTEHERKVKVYDLSYGDLDHFVQYDLEAGKYFINGLGQLLLLRGRSICCFTSGQTQSLSLLYKDIKVIPTEDSFFLFGVTSDKSCYLLSRYVSEESKVVIVASFPIPNSRGHYLTTYKGNILWLANSNMSENSLFSLDLAKMLKLKHNLILNRGLRAELDGCQITNMKFDGKHLSCIAAHMRLRLAYTILIDYKSGSMQFDRHVLKTPYPEPLLPCVIAGTKVVLTHLNRVIVLSDITEKADLSVNYHFDYGMQAIQVVKNVLVAVDTAGRLRIHRLGS